jgi:multidrug transporter EmrE-like cation transporter
MSQMKASMAPIPSGRPDRVSPWWPAEAADAVRISVTSLIAVYLAMYFELDEPQWAGWTVFSVSLATRANSIQKSTWRAIGTIVGAVASIVLMANFAQSTLAYDIAFALWLGIATYFSSLERGLGAYGFALMGYTVPIVTLGNVETPLQTFDTVVSRCSELILGIGCAYVSSVLVARGTAAIRSDLGNAVGAVARECVDWADASRDRSVWHPPPIGSVLTLDRQIVDAFTEQRSLRIGAHRFCCVPPLLLRLITEMLRRIRLGNETVGLTGKLDRIGAVARSFERHPRHGFRSASPRPLAGDRDTAQATHNALRTIIAVSLVNAF